MTLVIAHRGASGYATENTPDAFRKAFALKADGIELDLWPSAEGEPFVHHDENLKRIYGRDALIHQTPCATLHEAGVPTLAEVLEILPANAFAFLEIKGNVEARLAEDLRHHASRLAFLPVIGFNHAQLMRFKRLLPEATIGLTYDKRLLETTPPAQWAEMIMRDCAQAGAEHVNLDFRLATPALIETLHNNGLNVNLWTVNHSADLRTLRGLPLHSVMSDYPDRARSILHGEG